MAYLTSFKSSMLRQHWWPSRRKRVGVVFTEKSQAGIIHSILAQLSPVWQELCVEKTLTREIFQIFSIWTFEKGCQQRSFYSQRLKLMQKLELYFTSPRRTAGPSSDLMDDLSDQSVKDSCLFSLAQDNVSVDLPIVTNHSPQTYQALSKSHQNFLYWQEPIMLVYFRYSSTSTSSWSLGRSV